MQCKAAIVRNRWEDISSAVQCSTVQCKSGNESRARLIRITGSSSVRSGPSQRRCDEKSGQDSFSTKLLSINSLLSKWFSSCREVNISECRSNEDVDEHQHNAKRLKDDKDIPLRLIDSAITLEGVYVFVPFLPAQQRSDFFPNRLRN